MNHEHADSAPWRSYLGCCYPLVAIGALLLLLAILSAVVEGGAPQLPLRHFTPHPDYPGQLSLHEAVLVADTGLSWLMLVYVYWVVALVTCGICIVQLQKAIATCTRTQRKAINLLFAAAITITLAAMIYVTAVRDTPLMSFEYLLRSLQLVGQGLLDLTTYSTALAYIVLVTLVATISLLLVPGAHKGDSLRQFRGVTRIMYCAALFLLVWIVQATEMYRFAATLLVETERVEVLKLAPTISLVVGVLASLLLGGAYLAAYIWLQSRYRSVHGADLLHNRTSADNGPRHFLLEHWPRITALLLPAFPGIIGTFFNVVTQVV